MNDRPTLVKQKIAVDINSLLNLQAKANHWQRLPLQKQLSPLSGQYLSKHKGQGLDFNEVRPYTAGDDVRHIDWKITAKHNKPFTKLFHEERERPIFLVADQSPSMFFASKGQFKSVLAANICMSLAWISIIHKDKVALEIFNGHQQISLPLTGKKQAASRIAATITEFNPTQLYKQENATGLHQSLINLSHKHGGQIYICSDFYQLDSQIEFLLYALSKRNQIILVHIYDPIEKLAPKKALLPIKLSNHVRWLNTADKDTAQQWQSAFTQRKKQLQQIAQYPNISLLGASCSDCHWKTLKPIQSWWQH